MPKISDRKPKAEAKARGDGVVIGLLLGFDDTSPLVVFPSNPKEIAIPGRSLVPLTQDDVGVEVALLFEDGERLRPLIIGRIVDHVRPGGDKTILQDGEPIRIEADARLELVCGKAKIVLEKNGRITIRGSNVVSHASSANRIRGGSISLN